MYRIKQFIWAITGTFKKVDKEILKKYLTTEEIKIFNRLKASEQHHCIRVCKDSMILAKSKFKGINIDYMRLAKIALLHDVGKIEAPLNAIEKSIIVLLDKLSKGRLKGYTKYKKIDAYYNHPKKSVKILGAIKKYDNEFLSIIKNHHRKVEKQDDIYLNIIKICDDLN